MAHKALVIFSDRHFVIDNNHYDILYDVLGSNFDDADVACMARITDIRAIDMIVVNDKLVTDAVINSDAFKDAISSL